jgi:lipid-A-disaccharide synthase
MSGEAPLVYFIAGEPSGDFLAARLIASLKELTGGHIRFAGIGGENMAALGVESLFPIADLAVMGLVEVLPRLPLILRRLKDTLEDIARLQPAAVVTIDSWGFTGRVARALRANHSHIPRIHYVAPMVWAWKEGRAKGVAQRVDLLMTLFPNELAYFERHGLRSVHVGHPVIESGAGEGDGAAFRKRHGLACETPLLAVLPGSRPGEVARLLPAFQGAAEILAARLPGLAAVLPTVSTVAEMVEARTRDWRLPVLVLKGQEEKYGAFAASQAALAASGTVALELAMAGLPHVVAYKVHPITALAAKRLFKIPYVNLTNILLERQAVPEILQEACKPEILAKALWPLMTDDAARSLQQSQMEEAMRRLGLGGPSPSLRAAQEVLAMIREKRGET